MQSMRRRGMFNDAVFAVHRVRQTAPTTSRIMNERRVEVMLDCKT